MKLYEIIYNFIIEKTNCCKETLKEIIKFDIYLNDNIKSLPNWLENVENTSYKNMEKIFYNKEENIKKYLPHFKEKDSKQISKMCHFAKFNIDIKALLNSDFKNILEKENFILFDYYTKNDLVYKVTKYFLEEGDF